MLELDIIETKISTMLSGKEEISMEKKISVGIQLFEDVIQDDTFYVDKTKFIEDWWNEKVRVSLITRPGRFGKTLMMSTVECFFSNKYEGRGDLFDGLYICTVPEMMALQGTFPVVALSFSECKSLVDSRKNITEYAGMVQKMKTLLSNKFFAFNDVFEKSGSKLSRDDQRMFTIIRDNVHEEYTDDIFEYSIQLLCRLLFAHYGKKPIIILDEYDMPLREAYAHGYGNELVGLMRALFNTSFKTPSHYQRVLITGITRISRQSLFSDVYNIKTYSVTSRLYADSFGFTEKEVFDALDEYGLSSQKQNVKDWYDGFVMGGMKGIYNPYAIASFLDEQEFKTYWVDTSSNELVSQLIRHGNEETREDFQKLMKNKSFHCLIDENVVFEDLSHVEGAVWSLLLGSGYLKADEILRMDEEGGPLEQPIYSLSITNLETRIMFEDLVGQWFTSATDESSYREFIEALHAYDIAKMNYFMNKVALHSFSYFDNSGAFWQGFAIGLTVSLDKHYHVTSNRIAGTGRYDLQLKPKDKSMQAFIIEIKRSEGKQLRTAVREALQQIEERQYCTELEMEGYTVIRKLGIAYKGQVCLVGDEESMKSRRRKAGLE